MANSVQIDSDGAGGKRVFWSRSFSTANVCFYLRIKFPTISPTWAIALGWNGPGDEAGIVLDGGIPQIQWTDSAGTTQVVASPSASAWYDIFAAKNGSNADVYWKLSTSSVWNQLSVPAKIFSATNMLLADFPAAQSLIDKPTRYGKIVIFTTVVSDTIGKAEANFRSLQASGGVWFYNSCTDESAIHVDQSGSGNNGTPTGSPFAASTDDPGFPVLVQPTCDPYNSSWFGLNS